MHTVIFSIGKFTVYGYGLMIAIALIASVGIAMPRAKKYHLDADLLFNAALIGIIIGLVGSKLLYWLVEIKSVIANPKIMLQLGNGFVVYGGLVFGILAPIVYLKCIKKQEPMKYMDIAVTSIALGQAIGRIGCFLAGCCYGKECASDSLFAVTFPAGCSAPSGVALYPTQLFSSAADLVLFLILLYLTNREKFAGQLVAVYTILYSAGRFLIEFLRDDPRGHVGALSTSQFIAIFAFVGGIVLYIAMKKRAVAPLSRKAPAEEAPETVQPEEENTPDAAEQEETESIPETAEQEEAESVPETAEQEEAESVPETAEPAETEETLETDAPSQEE